MSTTRCPTCSTLRPANATHCSNCGTAFPGAARAAAAGSLASIPTRDVPDQPTWPKRVNVDLSIWTAVKLGAGFAVGVALVTLIFWLIVIALLDASLLGRLP